MQWFKSNVLKNIIYFIFYLTASHLCLSQAAYQEFLSEQDVYKKSELAYDLYYVYLQNDIDSLQILAVELSILYKEKGHELSKAIGESCLGSFYLRKGEDKRGIQYLKNSLEYYKRKKDLVNISRVLNEIGNGYSIAAEYHNAIRTYIASMDYGKKSNSETEYFNGGIGLAKVYFLLGDTIKGRSMMLEYKTEALKFDKYESAANALAYLAMVDLDGGDIEKSLTYFDLSIEYGLKSDSKVQLSHIYTNKAIVFFSIKQLDSSLIYFERALKLRFELNRPKQVVESYFNLASYYIEIEDYSSALIEIEKSRVIALNHNLLLDEYDAYELLEIVYKELGDKVRLVEVENKRAEISKRLMAKEELNIEELEFISDIESEVKEVLELKDSSVKYSWILILGILIVLFVGFYLWKGKWKEMDDSDLI